MMLLLLNDVFRSDLCVVYSLFQRVDVMVETAASDSYSRPQNSSELFVCGDGRGCSVSRRPACRDKNVNRSVN